MIGKGRYELNTIDLAREIVQILDDKQAEDILLLEITEISSFADYFIICSASSIRLVNALLKSVKEQVKDNHGLNPRVEGEAHAGWMLADYGDIILHIFSHERRNFYRLEDLWSEGKIIVRLQ